VDGIYEDFDGKRWWCYMSMRETIEAVKQAEFMQRSDRERAEHVLKQERLRYVECPDCKALLKLETKSDLPDDLKVVFVSHKC
jgi:hypothetical protein